MVQDCGVACLGTSVHMDGAGLSARVEYNRYEQQERTDVNFVWIGDFQTCGRLTPLPYIRAAAYRATTTSSSRVECRRMSLINMKVCNSTSYDGRTNRCISTCDLVQCGTKEGRPRRCVTFAQAVTFTSKRILLGIVAHSKLLSKNHRPRNLIPLLLPCQSFHNRQRKQHRRTRSLQNCQHIPSFSLAK
jgi:hypothetical protein